MPNTDEFIGVVISDVARLLRTAFDRRVRRSASPARNGWC
jgi:MarR family transcriptional regulator for hemolysin